MAMPQKVSKGPLREPARAKRPRGVIYPAAGGQGKGKKGKGRKAEGQSRPKASRRRHKVCEKISCEEKNRLEARLRAKNAWRRRNTGKKGEVAARGVRQ